MSAKLWYLAHPLSAGTLDGMEVNRCNAEAWCAWVARNFRGIIPIAPWIALSRSLEETDENRRWGLALDKQTLRLCEGLILCGGRISEGMREELAAKLEHQPVIDLTPFGYSPPSRYVRGVGGRGSVIDLTPFGYSPPWRKP